MAVRPSPTARLDPHRSSHVRHGCIGRRPGDPGSSPMKPCGAAHGYSIKPSCEFRCCCCPTDCNEQQATSDAVLKTYSYNSVITGCSSPPPLPPPSAGAVSAGPSFRRRKLCAHTAPFFALGAPLSSLPMATLHPPQSASLLRTHDETAVSGPIDKLP